MQPADQPRRRMVAGSQVIRPFQGELWIFPREPEPDRDHSFANGV
jgi:hypothetical protein